MFGSPLGPFARKGGGLAAPLGLNVGPPRVFIGSPQIVGPITNTAGVNFDRTPAAAPKQAPSHDPGRFGSCGRETVPAGRGLPPVAFAAPRRWTPVSSPGLDTVA